MKLIQSLSMEKLYLTMDQIQELHNNIKSIIDSTSIDFVTEVKFK